MKDQAPDDEAEDTKAVGDENGTTPIRAVRRYARSSGPRPMTGAGASSNDVLATPRPGSATPPKVVGHNARAECDPITRGYSYST